MNAGGLTCTGWPRRQGHSTPRRSGAGTIGELAGAPNDVDQWGWSCGFYLGSHPGEHSSGTAADFETARVEFEASWRIFSTKRTEADCQKWRHQWDFTAQKYVDGIALKC
jgi:hypothetical protein